MIESIKLLLLLLLLSSMWTAEGAPKGKTDKDLRSYSFTVALNNLNGDFSSKGGVDLAVTDVTTNTHFYGAESFGIDFKTKVSNGKQLLIGYTHAWWFGWYLSWINAEKQVTKQFDTVLGNSYEAIFKENFTLLSPFYVGIYPFHFFYIRGGLAYATDSGSMITSAPNLEKVEYSLKGNGYIISGGIDWLVLNPQMSLNAGMTYLSAKLRQSSEIWLNQGLPAEISVLFKPRKVEYTVYTLGVTMYF